MSRYINIIVGMLLVVVLVSAHVWRADAKTDPPLVKVGEIYEIVWTCLPIPQAPCYGDIVRVDVLRSDGLADVVQCQPGRDGRTVKCDSTDRWRSNLTHALSLRVHRVAGSAAN